MFEPLPEDSVSFSGSQERFALPAHGSPNLLAGSRPIPSPSVFIRGFIPLLLHRIPKLAAFLCNPKAIHDK
jgi:hypothetical protein